MLPSPPTDASEQSNASRFWLSLLSNRFFYLKLTALFLVADYFTGPFIQFPVFFIIPVAACAWFCSPKLAYFLCFLQPAARLVYNLFWDTPWDYSISILNALIRLVVLLLLAYFVSRSSRQHAELSRRVRLITGNLPICFQCKKVQDEQQQWQDIELYISRHSDTQFSHSLCPECARHDFADILGKEA